MENFLLTLNDFLWSFLFLPCVVLCGLTLSLRCGALQFRRFGLALRSTLFKPSDEAEGSESVTPFQAASTALAATVGTGNIVGTAQAIAMGGPGAVFWLWAAALLGMMVKYAEVYLGVRFRQRLPDGSLCGGPMYYIRFGLGRRFAPLAAGYAALAAVSALSMGNLTQVNSSVSAICHAVTAFIPLSGTELFKLRLVLGLCLAVLTAFILEGGIKKVGRVTGLLVPFMSLAFLTLTVAVIVCHVRRLPAVLADIIAGAFKPRSVLGAAGGLTLRQTVLWGFRRGAFSNEAGLGSAAIAHGSARTDSPVEHGLWGIFEVFVDTVVICSATALAILCSGVEIPWGSLPGPELLGKALATVYSERCAALVLSLSLFLFAFSSVIGSSVYGAACLRYLFGSRAEGPYRVLYTLCVLLGSVLSVSLIWLMTDTVNVLMSVPNFIALFALSGLISRDVKGYFFEKAKISSNICKSVP